MTWHENRSPASLQVTLTLQLRSKRGRANKPSLGASLPNVIRAALRARLYEFIQAKQQREQALKRKEQIGSGDRSGKIRTYNFPDNRVTDHRIGLTLHALSDILNGHFDPIVKALQQDEKERKLTDAA